MNINADNITTKKINKLTELNWEFTKETDISKKYENAKKASKARQDLIDDMGEREFNKFMEMGKKLFSPKQ